MNIRGFEYLSALAKYKHFGKAAQSCFVSQPTLSMQIKKLEEELGVVLLERNNKSVRLTPIGEEIVRHAHNILDECQTVVDIAQKAQHPFSGSISIGFIPTIAPYLLPRVLSKLRRGFPRLEFIITEAVTDELLQQVPEGKLDAAVLALPASHNRVDVIEMYYEPFLLAAHPTHPLIKKKPIKQSDLKHQQVLLLDEGHCLRDQALQICAQTGGMERTEVRSTSIETLRHLVAANMGITLIPELAAGKSTANIEYHRFHKNEVGRTIGIVCRKSFHRKPLVEKIAELITAMSRKWIEQP